MATRQHRQIIETPTEARQAEPGPSVLALLAVSTGLAILILGRSGTCSSEPDAARGRYRGKAGAARPEKSPRGTARRLMTGVDWNRTLGWTAGTAKA